MDAVPPTWRLYYDDGSTWDERDGPWSEAPTDGVIFVVEQRGDRNIIHSGCDYYVQFPDDGSIASSADLGPLLRRRPAMLTSQIKLGRWTSIATYERLSARVREEWR